MNNETIVAVFDSAEQADAAMRDLEAAGVPASAISLHNQTGAENQIVTGEPPRERRGFWERLFGTDPAPEHYSDTHVYDRSVATGGTVLTITGFDDSSVDVNNILERHQPIDIDERAQHYGSLPAASAAATAMASAPTMRRDDTDQDNTIDLAEETMKVGKRTVNRGTTRVRRYVVETPFEQQVNLRDETVSVERRPVAGDAASNPDFSGKMVEMTETAEEAVVAKSAHIREQVVLHKEVTERAETVRDRLRREDVEITKDAGQTARNASVRQPEAVGSQNPAMPKTSDI